MPGLAIGAVVVGAIVLVTQLVLVVGAPGWYAIPAGPVFAILVLLILRRR